MGSEDKVINLPGKYALRKEDDSKWWITYLGMDTLIIKPNVPCQPGGSIDWELEKLAEAMWHHNSVSDKDKP